MYNTLTIAVIVFVAFIILLTLLKSLVKAGIAIFVFIILFRVGWVYTSDDLKEKLHFDTIINKEYQDDFYNKYDEYTEKRKKDSLIDTDKINDEIDNQLDKLDEKVNNYIKDKGRELKP